MSTNVTMSYTPFLGRKNEFCMLVKYILDLDINTVNVHGIEGIGKTHIANELAKYMIVRDIFNGGVYYLDFKNV